MAILSRTRREAQRTAREKARRRRPRYPVHDIRGHSELVRGDTLRVRFSRLPGETPKTMLRAPFGLPVILNDFGYEEDAEHAEYRTIRFGEFSQPVGGVGFHGRSLRRLDLETLALDWDAPWLAHAGYSLEDVQSTLTAILRSKRAFRFGARLYSGTGPFELQMNATLRSVRPTRKPGERDTRYYTLSLAEWRDPSVRRRGENPAQTKLPTKHKLTATDTFNSLSKRYYGSYKGADFIRRRNGVGSFGDSTPIVKTRKFKVGDKIIIPSAETWRPTDRPRRGRDDFTED